MRYRHRPIVVEAKQWTRTNLGEVFGWLKVFGGNATATTASQLVIPTKHGKVTCEPGDYVVKGLNNEFFPCKPDAFKEKYELLRDDNDPEDQLEKKASSLDAQIVGQEKKEQGVQMTAPFKIEKKEKENMGLNITVEKNVPIASKSKTSNSEERAEIINAGKTLEVGDSVFVTCTEESKADNTRNIFLQTFKRHLGTRKKFTSRIVRDGKGQLEGVRVWRIL